MTNLLLFVISLLKKETYSDISCLLFSSVIPFDFAYSFSRMPSSAISKLSKRISFEGGAMDAPPPINSAGTSFITNVPVSGRETFPFLIKSPLSICDTAFKSISAIFPSIKLDSQS